MQKPGSRKPVVNPIPAMPPKDETYWKILNAAISLDFERGHQRWTISSLSRKARVTRSLIYYYFGKSRESILMEAVKLIGNELFGFHEREEELWAKREVGVAIMMTRNLLKYSPHLTAFYFSRRLHNDKIGLAIKELEIKYMERLGVFFPQAPRDHRECLFACFLGLTVVGEIGQASLSRFADGVLSVMTS